MTFLDWITSSVGTGVLLSVIGFLARNTIIERIKYSIKYEYEKDLEQHKADLRRDYDVQIEKLKAELAQQNFRYSEIFKHTAETIVRLYKKLLAVLGAAENYTEFLGEPLGEHKSSDKKELLSILQNKLEEFYEDYIPNKIYLPRDTMDKITLLMKTLKTLLRRHSMVRTMEEQQLPDPKIQERISEVDKLREDIPNLLLELENNFQSLLGLPTQNQKRV
ncbi:MAG TPA: hypothetical protein VMH87_07410 [Pseudomonadales bacterium]|nr:hypothetical protein [Pseudomonadales bacterium]